MKKVKIFITLKKGVLDPQGLTVKHALESLGYIEVSEVRMGKYMELKVEDFQDYSPERVEGMCKRLLANPIIEDYSYEIIEE